MANIETKPHRRMTEHELENEISHTFDAMSQQKDKLFQFFFFYNNKFGYIPMNEAIAMQNKMTEALNYATKTLGISSVSALLLDLAYLRKKTARLPLVWKFAWRIPYYGLISIFGYGYGYETKFEPISKEMADLVDKNRLDYNKYRSIYQALYTERVGQPLPEFDIEDKSD